LPLREDRLPVDHDLENTILALDEAGVRVELRFQLCRQPGGSWLVVSNDTIFDGDIHV